LDVGLSKADAPLNWFAALLAFTHDDDVCSVGGVHKNTHTHTHIMYYYYFFFIQYIIIVKVPRRVADSQVKRVYLFRNEICELHRYSSIVLTCTYHYDNTPICIRYRAH